VHYFWLVKKDVTDPIYWAVALLVLLALRLVKRPAPGLRPLPLSQEEGRSLT
jgi:DMSO/TMAO reductase YedYZ heme-binding membrane subunit